MSRTFASVYSGIGGADVGFAAAGWGVKWQCEADPYRRAVLARRFGTRVYCDVNMLPVAEVHADGAVIQLPEHVDLLYSELPDHRIDRWWPALWRVVRTVEPAWFILEFSPTVRADQVLRALALGGWAFRLVQLRTEIHCEGVDHEQRDVRNRGVVLACRDGAALDAIKLASHWVEMLITGASVAHHERLSLPWHEAARGFRVGYTCVCGHEPCACGSQARIAAIADATSPYLSRWLAELIDGTWGDGVERKLTAADGTCHHDGRILMSKPPICANCRAVKRDGRWSAPGAVPDSAAR